MSTNAITWVTYLAAIALMFMGCFRIHKKIRTKSSLLLLLTLPFYIFVHNVAISALIFFMNNRLPSWVNSWVMWAVTEYMPLFVMLLVAIAIFKVAQSIQRPDERLGSR